MFSYQPLQSADIRWGERFATKVDATKNTHPDIAQSLAEKVCSDVMTIIGKTLPAEIQRLNKVYTAMEQENARDAETLKTGINGVFDYFH